jgi:hypothetical protein
VNRKAVNVGGENNIMGLTISQNTRRMYAYWDHNLFRNSIVNRRGKLLI